MSVRLSFLGALAVVLLAVGCGGGKSGPPLNGDGGVDGGGLVITTSALPDAYAGAKYAEALGANGGHPPLTWTLTARASGLEWLQVDPATGNLSGVATVVTAGPVTVQVTDAAGAQATATLTLKVLACQEGDTQPCSAPQSGACYLGTQTCSGGTFGNCAPTQGPSTSPSQCGASCNSCGTTGDTCLDGACACGDTGKACTDGGTCCSAGCVDTTSDVHACGGCGIDCTQQRQPPNTDAGCDKSLCQYTCFPGYLNCDGADAVTGAGSSSSADTDGCEVDGNTDAKNCGACGYQCGAHLGTNATGATCSASSCQVTSCTTPYQDCDKSFANGCETNVSNTTASCGQCGYDCNAHLGSQATGATCSSSACQVTSCSAPYQDCDKNFANGCEVDLNTDVHNCGSCGYDCNQHLGVDATGASCSNGVCQVSTCASGYADCNGNFSDGCETNIAASDPNNCGGCGTYCPTTSDGSGGGQSCMGSQCCTTVCDYSQKPPCKIESCN